ncbi:hypothetical protein [Vibrio barjaei]|uniref:hypothetical protein n=1 Tax=Vibrio barjaei TaxID=1676683 RepID=UPI0022841C85|nr:hypothetical protein [Vibrio barjaei]MCY9873020.1 hypothetical protein [Vibrio barjaei]
MMNKKTITAIMLMLTSVSVHAICIDGGKSCIESVYKSEQSSRLSRTLPGAKLDGGLPNSSSLTDEKDLSGLESKITDVENSLYYLVNQLSERITILENMPVVVPEPPPTNPPAPQWKVVHDGSKITSYDLPSNWQFVKITMGVGSMTGPSAASFDTSGGYYEFSKGNAMSGSLRASYTMVVNMYGGKGTTYCNVSFGASGNNIKMSNTSCTGAGVFAWNTHQDPLRVSGAGFSKIEVYY